MGAWKGYQFECSYICRLLLLSVIRPSIEYRSEVWECKKGQADSLGSTILGGSERMLECSSKPAIRQL